MTKHLLLIAAMSLIPAWGAWAGAVVGSSVYDWEKLEARKSGDGEQRQIAAGPTRTLDMFEAKAITLKPGKAEGEREAADGFDELIIVKEGEVVFRLNGTEKRLGEGSVAVLAAGDKVAIGNEAKGNATFYRFLFKPKAGPEGAAAAQAHVPVIKEWKEIAFKPNAKGGSRGILKEPTAMLKQLEMHTTMLKEGLPSHDAHQHPDEEIILVRYGTVEETIKDKAFKVGPGSVIFLGSNDMHGIRNAGQGPCEYYAIRWLTGAETK